MGNKPGPDLLLDWDIPDESPSPPRFSPASPLPPEIEKWIEANKEVHPQTMLQRRPAQQEPCLILVQPPTSKPGQDSCLLEEPDNVAPSSIEAVSGHSDNGQLLMSEENETVLLEAGASELVHIPAENHAALPEGGASEKVLPRPENGEFLLVPPFELDRQTGGNAADPSAQPPRLPPASSLPPEIEEWIEASTQEAHPQTLPQPRLAQQEPCRIFVQPPASKPVQDPCPLDEPDNAAPSSSEAVSDQFDNGPLLLSEENGAVLLEGEAPEPALVQAGNHVALLEAGAPASALLRSENAVALPEAEAPVSVLPRPEKRDSLSISSIELDRQTDGNAPGKPVQPSRLPPASPPQPERGKQFARRGRWKPKIIFLIVTGLLILAGGQFLFQGYLASLSSLQTATRSTSTNDALNEQETATAESANTDPYVSGGSLVFSDTFNSASSNWDQNTDCAFTDGGYRVTTASFQACALNAHVPLANFVLEVNVTLLRGDVGGFFFRVNRHAHKTNAYLLNFDSKGNYQVWNYSTPTGLKLLAHGVSSNLNTGYDQMNTIALVAQGSNITLYINGRRVEHLIDHMYSKGGLSLISSEYAHHTGVSQATYKDLRLWQL